MRHNSECLFLPKLLVNNHECKHLSHGPGPAGSEPPLGRTWSHFAALHIYLFRPTGEWAEAFKQNVFRGFVLRTSCLQMTCRYTHKPPAPLVSPLLIKRLVEAQTSSAAQPL